MKDVALFYGTYTGVTGTVAQKIVNELGADKVDLYNCWFATVENMEKSNALKFSFWRLYILELL